MHSNIETDTIHHLPLATIQPDPDNVRAKLNGIDELAASIKATGQLVPIVVTQTDSGYRLVAGHRRFAAVQLLKLETIAAIVRDFGANARTVQLVENMQREDLSAIDVADAIAELVAGGASLDAVADNVGKSQNWVRKHLALLKGEPKVVTAIRRNGLSFTQALVVAKVAKEQTPEDALRVASEMRTVGLTTRAASKKPTENARAKRTYTASAEHHRMTLTIESAQALSDGAMTQVKHFFDLANDALVEEHVQR